MINCVKRFSQIKVKDKFSKSFTVIVSIEICWFFIVLLPVIMTVTFRLYWGCHESADDEWLCIFPIIVPLYSVVALYTVNVDVVSLAVALMSVRLKYITSNDGSVKTQARIAAWFHFHQHTFCTFWGATQAYVAARVKVDPDGTYMV